MLKTRPGMKPFKYFYFPFPIWKWNKFSYFSYFSFFFFSVFLFKNASINFYVKFMLILCEFYVNFLKGNKGKTCGHSFSAVWAATTSIQDAKCTESLPLHNKNTTPCVARQNHNKKAPAKKARRAREYPIIYNIYSIDQRAEEEARSASALVVAH